MMFASLKSSLERGKVRRRVALRKAHKPLHKAHHVLHLGYLASIVLDSREAHVLLCAGMLAVILCGHLLGDEI